MISPEILRRYPFFSFMDHNQLREIAMITDEVEVRKDDILFNIDAPADAIYLLMEGAIDLHFIVVDELKTEIRKGFVVGTINSGEVLGISTLIEPFIYTATAMANNDSRLLKIDGNSLRDLCDQDNKLCFGFQQMLAKATMERLHATRVKLLAATQTPE